MTDFQLTPHEKTQGLWLRLAAHLEDRLALARIRNDGQLHEHATAMLRGEIACLKKLIALGADRPIMTGEDEAL